MNKILIPRKDHEVYFIPIPEDIKQKELRSFGTGQLDKLHPGFSGKSAVDLQYFSFDNARWIMATVMEAETLEEYKILNKNAVFFTNTSIIVHQSDFLQAGFQTIDDEYIGFDADKKVPASTPLELERKRTTQELESQLKTFPSRYGVFIKKTPYWRIALVGTIIGLALLTSFAFAFLPKNEIQDPLPVVHTETFTETKHFPLAVETLAKLARDIRNANGTMQRWQYNEDSDPLIMIQLRGMEVSRIHKILGQYQFAFLLDVQNVNYTDGEPYTTISMNTAQTEYLIPASTQFPAQNSSILMISEITSIFQQSGISIASETFPTNNNALYTISYTANDRELIRSLEIITNICLEHPLRIKKIDISISTDKHMFAVIASLAYSNTPNRKIPEWENDRNVIPMAFGYTTPAPPALPRITVLPEPIIKPPVIGSIRDGGTHIVFYRDISSSRATIREHQ